MACISNFLVRCLCNNFWLLKRLAVLRLYVQFFGFSCYGKCRASFNLIHLMQLKGTIFEGIDLSGDEFVEYDERGEAPVMTSRPSATFNVVK